MKITLSISPCPNDTFMFDALVNGRIDTQGLEFDVRFADIEELNAGLLSSEGNAPIMSKASYAVAGEVSDRYDVLSAGSALGRGNGPLWVTGNNSDVGITDFSMRVAIPGERTTANLLMNVLHPHVARKRPVLFSQIADTIVRGEFDSGVLIHEGRFTYQEKGLRLLADLGAEWESLTGLPLPLGAIVISKELPAEVKIKVNTLLQSSVNYAFANPEASRQFVTRHAQEIDETVIRSHIELFVNEYSVSLGDEGKLAVRRLLGPQGEKLTFIE